MARENEERLTLRDGLGHHYTLKTPANMTLDYEVEVNPFSPVVHLTKTQILGMNATPVVIIPAPGAGKFIEFLGGVVSVTFSVAAYTAGGAVSFRYSDGLSTTPISATLSAANTFGNAASQVWSVLPTGTLGGAAATYQNLGIVLGNDTAAFTDPGTAAGTARVYVSYRVHDLA